VLVLTAPWAPIYRPQIHYDLLFVMRFAKLIHNIYETRTLIT
jgi:hypothetical protein